MLQVRLSPSGLTSPIRRPRAQQAWRLRPRCAVERSRTVKADPSLLPALLHDNERFAFEHGPGFANHNSMGLVALAAMGASADDLHVFYDGHAPHQAPLGPPDPKAGAPIDATNWQEGLGTRRQAVGYLRFFLQEAQGLTATELLQRYMPRLIGGVGAGGFHSVLRLAYALLLERDLGVPARREVAHGLAYLASSYLDLGHSDAPAEACAVLVERLGRGAEVVRGAPPSLLAPRMRKESRQPHFTAQAGTPLWHPGVWEELVTFARQAHGAGDNIASLHMITGLHALRLLWPFCGDQQAALAVTWRALAALYMTAGAPLLPAPDAAAASTPVADWEALCARARHARDVHVIKLVYSCREESRVFGADVDYRSIAQRALDADPVAGSQSPH